MTKDKIIEVAEIYQELFKLQKIKPKRLNHSKEAGQCTKKELRGHLYYMVSNAIAFAQTNKIEKAFDYLRFVQGALFMMDEYTIEDLEKHNQSDNKN